MIGPCDHRDQRLAGRIGRDCDDFGPRHHDLSGGQVGKAEDAMEHLLFMLFENTRFLTCRHEHLELFLRVHEAMLSGSVQAQHAHHGPSGPIQESDEWPECPHEQLGRLDHQQGGRLRALQRDRLGRELAQNDVQSGDDDECDGNGDAVRGAFRHGRRQERESRLENRGERRLGNPPQPDARHRDAELRRRDVPVGQSDGAPHGVRAQMALSDQLIDARLAHGHDREFRGNEESVGEHEGHDAPQPPHNAHERVIHGTSQQVIESLGQDQLPDHQITQFPNR